MFAFSVRGMKMIAVRCWRSELVFLRELRVRARAHLLPDPVILSISGLVCST